MKIYFFTSAQVLGLVFCFLLGSIAVSKVMAESGIGNDVFKVVVSLWNYKFNERHSNNRQCP
jgi:hypothetical protein